MTTQLTQHRYAVMLAPGGHAIARRLVVNVFAQALLDIKDRSTYTSEQALAWLRTPGARALADWIELELPEEITRATVAKLHHFRVKRKKKEEIA